MLVFEVGETSYGLDTSAVQEIVPARTMTRLPGAPEHVTGLLNLRGTLVTVVDLSWLLIGKPSTVDERSTVIVRSGGHFLGLIVDDVHDVHDVDDAHLLAVAGMTSQSADAGRSITRELGHFEDRVVLLVDVAELVRQTLA